MKKIYAKIFLSDGSIETIDYYRLVSCETNNIGVSDIRTPSYGIVLPSGRIEFKDVNGYFLEKLNNDLGHDAKVKFYFSETTKGTQKHIATFIAREWDYDKENKIVMCNLVSKFENLKEQIVTPTEDFLNRTKIEPMSLRSILFSQIISKDEFFLDFDEEEDELSYMFVEYPFLEENASKWYHIDQIAKVSARYCIVVYDENEEERLSFLLIDYN